MTTPIFINTFVVFVRLYWFEKRFQNLVKEARNLRRTRTRSRTRSEARADRDVDMDMDREERGVGGREIVVLRGPDGHAKGYKLEDEKDGAAEPKPATESARTDDSSNSTSTNADKDEPYQEDNGEGPVKIHSHEAWEQAPPFHRDIKFADEVRPPQRRAEHSLRTPEQRTREQHIAFIESQRNIKHEGILRIPGPRDFDRGDLPTRLDEDEESAGLDRTLSRDDGPAEPEVGGPAGREAPSELNWDDHPMKPHITIDDHDRSHGRLKDGLANFRLNRSDRAATMDSSMGLRQRGRTRTFASFLTSRSQERSQERDPMPYLSYAATVGRNSTFIDLTEEQREELGGIEYRSLKTLAFVLIGEFFMLRTGTLPTRY